MNTFVKNEEGMGHGKYNSSHFYQSYKKNSPKKKTIQMFSGTQNRVNSDDRLVEKW